MVHLQACVWAVLQTTERQQPPYASALMEVLTALVSLGYRVPYDEQTLALQIFEVVLALERLSLACALIELCVSRVAGIVHSNAMENAPMRESALRYLSRHGVSQDTQDHVMSCLTEGSTTRITRQHFIQASEVLPPLLNQKILARAVGGPFAEARAHPAHQLLVGGLHV